MNLLQICYIIKKTYTNKGGGGGLQHILIKINYLLHVQLILKFENFLNFHTLFIMLLFVCVFV